MKKIELLAPGGNLEKVKNAVDFGADAVYCAGKNYGLRATAGNLTSEELAEAVAYVHEKNKQLYLTVNVYAHNDDLVGLEAYLCEVKEIGVDALIISDPGILRIASRIVDLPIHISTQANTTNFEAAEFWREQGADRVVLARELSLAEIKSMGEKTQAELEIFIHGAMCVSYSGRCLLSNFLTGRDANQGACTHPCRWKYHLVEDKRGLTDLIAEEDERGTYFMNSKDLCLLSYLPELIKAGVTSFKIEGRMKSVYYNAVVTKVYRQALDACLQDENYFASRLAEWQVELARVSHRGYTEGFIQGKPDADAQCYDTAAYIQKYDFVGKVLSFLPEKQVCLIEQRNHFVQGDLLEVVVPEGENLAVTVEEMWDEKWQPLTTAPHPQQKIYLKTKEALPAKALLRRKIKD